MKFSDRFYDLIAFSIEVLLTLMLFLSPVSLAFLFAFPLWMGGDKTTAILLLSVAGITGILLARWVWKQELPSTFYGRLSQGDRNETSNERNLPK